MKSSEKSIMPAVIVWIAMLGFYVGGGYILYKAFNPTEGSLIDSAKTLSILDMVVIAAIGSMTGSVGYWLGKNHSDQEKDQMIYNSTRSPEPTQQVVTSTVTSKSTLEPTPAAVVPAVASPDVKI